MFEVLAVICVARFIYARGIYPAFGAVLFVVLVVLAYIGIF